MPPALALVTAAVLVVVEVLPGQEKSSRTLDESYLTWSAAQAEAIERQAE